MQTNSDSNWKAKEGVTLSQAEVAKIACGLKSLAVYASLSCGDEQPEDLRETVMDGLQAIDRLFDY